METVVVLVVSTGWDLNPGGKGVLVVREHRVGGRGSAHRRRRCWRPGARAEEQVGVPGVHPDGMGIILAGDRQPGVIADTAQANWVGGRIVLGLTAYMVARRCFKLGGVFQVTARQPSAQAT